MSHGFGLKENSLAAMFMENLRSFYMCSKNSLLLRPTIPEFNPYLGFSPCFKIYRKVQRRITIKQTSFLLASDGMYGPFQSEGNDDERQNSGGRRKQEGAGQKLSGSWLDICQ